MTTGKAVVRIKTKKKEGGEGKKYSKKEMSERKTQKRKKWLWQLSFRDLPQGTESATTHTHTTKHTQKALRLIHTLRKSRITIGGWQKSIMTHPLTKNGLWSRTVLSAHTWLHTNTQTDCWRITPLSALTTLSLQELQRERERRRGCERRTARELQQQELMK